MVSLLLRRATCALLARRPPLHQLRWAATHAHTRCCDSHSSLGHLPSPSSAAPCLTGAPRLRRASSMSGQVAPASTSGDTAVIVVYVTVPSQDVGESLASQLVESELAACVNTVPGLTSVYRWEGQVQKDQELLLIIKSRATLLEQLTARVRQLHPYDEPEVLALPAVGGSASYLKWVLDSTAGAS